MDMSPRSIALLFSPVGLLLISATRLFIISDYNTTTAVTVASSGGYLNTLLGSVIPLVPVFMPYIALILLLFRRFLLSIIAFVFAAFITPTPLTLPATLRVLKADEQRVLAQIASNRVIDVVIALIIIAILAAATNNIVETLSGFVIVITALTLLLTTSNAYLSVPVSLRLASNSEHRVIALASGHPAIVLLIVIVSFVALISYRSPARALTGGIAVLATVALFPYIYNIYPVPRHQNYYAEVLHELWLPPERITLRTSAIYYGYVLSADQDWFTLLLINSRMIVYLRTEEVADRAVCEAGQNDQPTQYPPLVRILFTQPPRISSCTSEMSSIRSDGESLNAISSAAHVTPQQIISATNLHQRQRLSARLRAYERLADWNAPTPVGQHFWYYPPSKS
jgi:hypothetical protein